MVMTPVAHYNLLERIGEGGIGELFRARDTKVGRTVALKIVSEAIVRDPDRLIRLLEDAQHPAADRGADLEAQRLRVARRAWPGLQQGGLGLLEESGARR
jgi:serine/threonine protein kinase